MSWAEVTAFAARHWLGVAFGLVAAGFGAVWRHLRRERRAGRAMRTGLAALLADRLIQLHGDCAARGYCPPHLRESAKTIYDAYREIGPAGAVGDVYDALRRLPLAEKGKRRQEDDGAEQAYVPGGMGRGGCPGAGAADDAGGYRYGVQ